MLVCDLFPRLRDALGVTLDLTLIQGIYQYTVTKMSENWAEVTMHHTKYKYLIVGTVISNW